VTQKNTIKEWIDRGDLVRHARDGLFIAVALNLTALISPIFFMQVYDRVLTTGSVPTLLVLTLLAALAVALGAAFEQVRAVSFLKAGAALYLDLEEQVYRACQRRALAGAQGRRAQPFDDLEAMRSVLASPLPGAILDLIFAPLFLLVLFMLHFWLGLFALAVLVAMAIISALTQWTIASSIRQAHEAQMRAANAAESQLRAAEAVAAMGFLGPALARWSEPSRAAVSEQIRSAATAGGLTAAARGVRSGAQIFIVAIAAALALQAGVSAGAVIASSIILTRLIAPVDQLLGAWRQVAQAMLAQQRLTALLAEAPPAIDHPAPAPNGPLEVDNLTAGTGQSGVILRGLSFAAEPGEVLAVIGPVGSGKSTLLRCALGIWPFSAGSVRLGGVPLAEVDRDRIGPHLGFLPQNPDLLPGTIAENIRRFGPPDPDGVMAAAQAVGAAELIARLPNGYDADVGEGGASLSAGQRRRIAMARAFYGQPALVVLDEPEAHLDRDGELALVAALRALKARGAIVLVAAHRPALAAMADRVMILKEGRIAQIGPASEVLQAVAPQPLREVKP
jgi:ATP-binding cassette, subfamily C, bacterial exporter for protease/lipase